MKTENYVFLSIRVEKTIRNILCMFTQYIQQMLNVFQD